MELLPPLFVQVAITFLLVIMTGITRYVAAKQGKVKVSDIALREPGWPKSVTKISNALHNQLETPILFYLLVVLLLVTKQGDQTYLMLAWSYVAVRLVHLAIHLTINHVLYRFLIFVTSMLILMVMWGRFGLAIM